MHPTSVQMTAFCERSGTSGALAQMAMHLSTCHLCRTEYARRRAGSRESLGLVIDRAVWLSDEHLEYEQKRAYAEKLMEAEALEMTEAHLELCSMCRSEMGAYLADRGENQKEVDRRLAVRVLASPQARASSWRLGGLWTPMRVAALIALAFFATAFLMYRFQQSSEVARMHGESSLPSKVGTTPAPAGGRPSSSEEGSVPNALEARGRKLVEAGGNSSTPGPMVPRTRPSPGLRMTLRDQGRELVLESRVRGVAGASDSELEAITGVLVSEEIAVPPVISDLWGTEGGLRGPRRAFFALLRPRREVIRETQPVFRWEKVRDAESYEVFIADARHSRVVSSGRLSGDTLEWRPPTPLERGRSYSWTVSALARGEEFISPTPADAEWRFRVLRDEEMAGLLLFEKRMDSHLARAVEYTRLGLLSEAEVELERLVRENPDSPAVRRLLERVRAWR